MSDILKDPMTFPCGHSYCTNCIRDCWNDQLEAYSCSRCTFIPEPALDVECDVCTDKKHKSVKSCLECLKSFCQNHLEQHEGLFQDNKHNLIHRTDRLNDMICPKHKKPLEIYCRTDQQCICYQCTVEGHKHEIVKVEAERSEKRRHLRETQRNFQRRIQEREKELQECSAQTAVKNIERTCNELIQLIKKTRSEETRLIRDQEKASVSQADGLLKQLEQEIEDLRKRDAKLERLLHTDDLIQFLQSFQSVSPLINPRPGLSSYNQSVFKFTLDLNTVNKNLCLSDWNTVASDSETEQRYPDHPERFEYFAQVLCKESVSGRCYWEVEWSGNAGVYIAVTYKTISRKSNEDESSFEHSNQSWGVYCRPSVFSLSSSTPQPPQPETLSDLNQTLFRQTLWTEGQSVKRNSTMTKLPPVSSCCTRIGVFVDHSAGSLSFYSISDTMTLIHSVKTTFTQPLYPGFTVYKGSTMKLYNPTK